MDGAPHRSCVVDTPAARVVFLCHPFRSDPESSATSVRTLARRLALQGHLPIAPQIYLPQFLEEATERDLALRCCLRLVALVDEVWVYGKPTEGMGMEIAEAIRIGIPVVMKDLPRENRPGTGAVVEEGTT